MSVALLDVNVLVALFDPAHVNHDQAHDWFAVHRKSGWATCPITLNGCVRILSHPAYHTVEATPEEVVKRLTVLCTSQHHEFWPDALSLLDPGIFRHSKLTSHGTVTDAYLLALAVHRNGRLITFDQTIPVRAVVRGRPHHLVVLGVR